MQRKWRSFQVFLFFFFNNNDLLQREKAQMVAVEFIRRQNALKRLDAGAQPGPPELRSRMLRVRMDAEDDAEVGSSFLLKSKQRGWR